MYVGTADLRYLSRFNVNRGLGDIKPETFETPVVPYRELSSAPLDLIERQQEARIALLERDVAQARRIHTPPHPHAVGLAGLEGFFSTSKKWSKRHALMMRDVKVLQWWGYQFTREDEAYIRAVEFKVAKERAKRSGMDRLVKDVALPVMLTIATAGAATPLAISLAAGSTAVGAIATRKLEKEAIKTAEKGFVINEEVIATEHELEDIQKEIAEMQKQSGIPKPVINKGIQDAANKQAAQKKTLTTILLAGATLGVAAMAA